MENLKNIIELNYTDSTINSLLNKEWPVSESYTLHYNSKEEFFLRLKTPYTVPALPVHHDYRKDEPEKNYLKGLRKTLDNLVPLIPKVFEGLTYFFDPTEVLEPCFFKIYKIEDQRYLYLLRLDLHQKINEGKVLKPETNDLTASFESYSVYLDANIIPLDKVVVEKQKIRSFLVRQLISQTWIGETGRGYLVQGIWIDQELSKFFTKLFIPNGKKIYPFYPFSCKFRTFVRVPLHPVESERRRCLKSLHRGLKFLEPRIRTIEQALRSQEFSPSMPLFKSLKKLITPVWTEEWKQIKVNAYLNEFEMKEYQVEVDSKGTFR